MTAPTYSPSPYNYPPAAPNPVKPLASRWSGPYRQIRYSHGKRQYDERALRPALAFVYWRSPYRYPLRDRRAVRIRRLK